jgi:uncharacterized protein YbbC (DUF1343 family)
MMFRRTSAIALLLLAVGCAHTPAVKLGIDALSDQHFAPLLDKRVAVLTNANGVDAHGTHLIQLLIKNDVNVVKLFAPEHGLYGDKDEKFADGVDAKTGLPVVSLYGKIKTPTKEMFDGVDVVVFDIQDVGSRYYTYLKTLGLSMRTAGASNVQFIVLDRPNPISGTRVEGPIAEPKEMGDFKEGAEFQALPIAHGLTIGELAAYYNDQMKLGTNLLVIPMQGWAREMYWEETGVKWINPSPNMRSPRAAVLYPALGLLETVNVSVGRGTPIPFEQFGAPYIDAKQLSAALTKLNLAGVEFSPVTFTPHDKIHKLNGEVCHGVKLKVTDRATFDSTLTGMSIAWTLNKLYPDQWGGKALLNKSAKNGEALDKLFALEDPTQANTIWDESLEAWKAMRAKYLRY